MSNEDLRTGVGHAEWGDNNFRGYSVARDLAGREGVTSLLALAIAGRRLAEDERLMLDDLATATHVADPRIWPLKLARVTSAYGGSHAGVAAAIVSADGARLGHQATGRAAELLVQLRAGFLTENGKGAESGNAILEDHCRRLLANQNRPVGFGVPFRQRDERVDILTDRVAARGRSELPYWRLYAAVGETVWRIKSVRPNMTLASAAVFLDMGFTPAQIGPLMTAIGASAFWANAFEGAEQAPACLQTLPEGSVNYVGPAPRRSPRADRALSK